MKAIYYITFGILVLAVSVFIHKPSSVKKQETEIQVVREVQQQQPLRTSAPESEHHQNEVKEDLSKGDTNRPSDLVEKERAFIEGPRTSFQAAVERAETGDTDATQARWPEPSSAAHKDGEASAPLLETHAALEEAFAKIRRNRPVDEGYGTGRGDSSSKPASKPDFPSEEEVLEAFGVHLGDEEDHLFFEDFSDAAGQYLNDNRFVDNSPFE